MNEYGFILFYVESKQQSNLTPCPYISCIEKGALSSDIRKV